MTHSTENRSGIRARESLGDGGDVVDPGDDVFRKSSIDTETTVFDADAILF
jgi:hypothetical protein